MNTNSLFPTLPESSDRTTLQFIQLTSNRKFSIGQLQQCWAWLIKLYTTRPFVSFVYIRSTSHDGGPFNAVSTHSTSTPFARILSYQDLNVGSETQMTYRMWKAIEDQSLEQDQVNTAIILCKGDDKVEDDKSVLPLLQGIPRLEGGKRIHLLLISSTETPKLIIQYAPNVIPPLYAESIAHIFEKILSLLESGGIIRDLWSKLALLIYKRHLTEWNNPAPTPINATLHGLVHAIAQSSPQAEAICAWDGMLSYEKLENLSTTLARHLMELGVEKGAYVAYAFEKSLWAVVAMLGIVKAGAAFVAFEPTQSPERLQTLQRILGCSMVVTSELQASKIGTLGLRTCVLPRDISITIQSSSFHRYAEPMVKSSDAALILFTSGSTGQPKAIIHEHGSICSHAVALGEAMGYRGARVLQFSAYAWDVAVMDIFITLIHGGCVCIPSEEDRINDIAAFISWSRMDLALLTPSFARSINPQSIPTLKTLALAGECMTHEDIDRWSDRVTLINAYGPAEVGVCAVNILGRGNQRPENIGRSLRNSPCWIVNPENFHQLLPPGAIGELVVAGPNLARGYLNHPEHTDDPFFVNPIWAVEIGLPYSRFYRTGDLVSYDLHTLDGSMNFMGRKDDQIKVRGQRIEPGEVEYHLNQIQDFHRSIVIMPHHGFWKGELIAAMETVSSQSRPSGLDAPIIQLANDGLVSTMRDHLSRHLPHYMVPTACFTVTCFPITLPMKIDRRRVKGWVEQSEGQQEWLVNDPKASLKSSEHTAWKVSSAVDEFIRSINPARQISTTGYDVSLNEIPLDSIQIITLFSTLRARFGGRLPFQAVLKSKMTIRGIAQLIDNPEEQSSHDGESWTMVKNEAESISRQLLQALRSQRVLHKFNNQHVIRNVLLTGASGYLGRRILRKLLHQDGLHVYVHLRAHNKRSDENIFKNIALREGWWEESFTSRYTVWSGDLAQPTIGLDQHHLDLLQGKGQLSEVVNGIIHCGAVVHYSLGYTTLRQANVISTTTLLEATARSPFLRRFVFISGGRKPSLVGDSSNQGRSLSNGYSQSKYVCDQIIQAANSDPTFAEKHIGVIHPGYIVGSLEDGLANKDDFFWRMIAGCIEIGAYNQDESDRWVFVSDVDTVSQVAVGALLRREERDDPEHHILTEGMRFHHIWDVLRLEYGYDLVGMPGDQWLLTLKAVILRTGESHILFPLLPTLETQGRALGDSSVPTAKPSTTIMACIRMNITYLIRTGFFPPSTSISPVA